MIRKNRIPGSLSGKGRGNAGDGSEGRDGTLVADRCYVLQEVTVVDMRDSGGAICSPSLSSPVIRLLNPFPSADLTSAIKIRRGKEIAIFRTEKNADKKSLLASFRQVAEALANKKRGQLEKDQERRRSMWQGDLGVSAR